MPDSNPGLVLAGVGPTDGLFHFSKTLHLVDRDSKYLRHRVGVGVRSKQRN